MTSLTALISRLRSLEAKAGFKYIRQSGNEIRTGSHVEFKAYGIVPKYNAAISFVVTSVDTLPTLLSALEKAVTALEFCSVEGTDRIKRQARLALEEINKLCGGSVGLEKVPFGGPPSDKP